MPRTGKLLVKIAGIIFVPILLVTMVLGYSGSAQLAGVGNVIFLLTTLLCLPLAVIGAVMWITGRREPG